MSDKNEKLEKKASEKKNKDVSVQDSSNEEVPQEEAKAKETSQDEVKEEAKADEAPKEEAKAEADVQEVSEPEEPKQEEKDDLPDIKLSGLMGTKLGMTQTLMDDGEIIPTTVVKLGPCLALEKKVKNSKTSLKNSL